jgi:hypothetical protein
MKCTRIGGKKVQLLVFSDRSRNERHLINYRHCLRRNSHGQQLNSHGQQLISDGQKLNIDGQQLISDGQTLNIDGQQLIRNRSTRREPPTMGKQLVNFITCGCESNAPFL